MSNFLGQQEEHQSTASTADLQNTGPDPDLVLRVKSGANWFYWIAALSMINSFAFIAGANFSFLAGLGFTQIADGLTDASIAGGASSAVKVVAFVFDLIVVIGFALAGYFANKFFRTAFMVGIAVYVVDAIVLLLLGAYLPAGFHVFALIFIVRGFLACREIKAQQAANAVDVVPPPPSFA